MKGENYLMKIYAKSQKNLNPQGKPPKNLIQTFRRRYEYDVDDYYGYMFLIQPAQFKDAVNFANKYEFDLYPDPDNDSWYYLMYKD